MITECGVLQGSTLGPLLFLVYIDLSHCAQGENFIMYADNCTLMVSDVSKIAIMKKANTALENINISSWFTQNQVSLNISKTRGIMFSKHIIPDKDSSQVVKIHNQIIETVAGIKLLGVEFDDKLTWRSHVSNVLSKINELFSCYIT